MAEEKKRKKVFMEGAISPTFIADSIAKHSSKKDIGAHSIFLGQVRNDLIQNQEVKGIEYSCYQEMAEEKLHEIRENCFEKYPLSCLHVYHSLGMVEVGEICLFVFTSSKHRAAATDACSYLVERIKKEVPIWGKELFGGDDFAWKVNKN
ncbi:MAG: molybdenum cofactor biosynthesis protein MoaE [Bacteroidia bacterium]|nr:molybdenum cofactor biosynthesis protein MoaE [Bacteroidia bacterium]MCF8425412.1 molybdenum cofactor biosynthesis protein MoaE [Bacteroidia bacterium]MCF8447104.1 molybdenum cofactor biosynthesis protein MoaE [Bacteroidia bacterium]